MIIVAGVVISVMLILALGLAVGGVGLWQEEYNRRIRLEVDVNRLAARELPPRRLEVWIYREKGGVRAVTMGHVDADAVVEALTLVAKGIRAFSVEGLRGVLTRSEVEALRGEVFKLGLAAWHPSGPNAGVVWTRDGQAMLDTLAGKPPGEEGVCMGMCVSAGGNGHQ